MFTRQHQSRLPFPITAGSKIGSPGTTIVMIVATSTTICRSTPATALRRRNISHTFAFESAILWPVNRYWRGF